MSEPLEAQPSMKLTLLVPLEKVPKLLHVPPMVIDPLPASRVPPGWMDKSRTLASDPEPSCREPPTTTSVQERLTLPPPNETVPPAGMMRSASAEPGINAMKQSQ